MNVKNYVLGTLSNDAFVMVNKKLAKKLGFVEAGILGELISTYKYAEENQKFFEDGERGNWFYLTKAKVEEKLGIKEKQHDNAIKKLEKRLIITKERMGLPAKSYYLINWEKIVEILEENEAEPAPLSDSTKRRNKGGRNVGTRPDETSVHTIYKNEYIKTNNKNIVNKENESHLENYDLDKKIDETTQYKNLIVNTANDFYNEFTVGRWSKKDWTTIVNKIADEIIESYDRPKNLVRYIYACLKNIAYKHDVKHGKVDFKDKFDSEDNFIPFYNWLED